MKQPLSGYKGWKHLLSLFVLGVALIAVYKTFDNVGVIFGFIGRIWSILTPFVVGLGLAFLLYAPVNKLETALSKGRLRRVARHSRALAVLTVYVLLVLLLAGLLTFALPALIQGIIRFVAHLPAYYSQLTEYLQSLTAEHSLLAGLDIPKAVDQLYGTYIEPRLTTEAVMTYFKGLMDFTSSLFDVFLAFIISIYMLLTRESLLRTGKQLLGLFLSQRIIQGLAYYTHRSCAILYSYFYSQILDGLIVGVLMTIGLGLARAPSAPLLGFLIGLFNLIPYFGAIIGGALAIAVTLLSGNLYGAIFAAVYVIAIQQVDANLIQPRIVSNTVGIRPIYVLLAITLFGGLFGFWGIFFGVPMIAIIQMLFRDYIIYRQHIGKHPVPPSV